MTPTRDPDPLEDRLRQALAGRAAATTVGEPHLAVRPDGERGASTDSDPPALGADEVMLLPAPPAPPHRTSRRWARPAVAAAAAVVVLAGGLFAAGRLTRDDGQTVAGTPPGPDATQDPDAPPDSGTPPDPATNCGSELPFALPVPDGFEGPVPGPVTTEMEGNDFWNGIALRWQGEGGTIDVHWPGYPPIDPASYNQPGGEPVKPQLIEGEIVPANGQASQTLDAYADDLGGGACFGFTVTVTTPEEASTAAVMDHVEVGLLGPDGVLPGPREPLVASETSADALPSASPCEGGSTPVVSGTGEGQSAHPSPDEALHVYLATRTSITIDGYERVALPDGSYGYVARQELDPNFILLVVHVQQSEDGWVVASWESSGC